jgi:hypothetical protein
MTIPNINSTGFTIVQKMLGMVVDVQILSFISTSGIQKMLGMVVDVQILSFISTSGIQKMLGMVVDVQILSFISTSGIPMTGKSLCPERLMVPRPWGIETKYIIKR